MEVEVKHLDRARRLLLSISGPGLRQVLRDIVKQATPEIMERMAVYPPEGPWNRPAGPGSRWHQRLWGPRWMTKKGELRGRNTSEQLQKSWHARAQGPVGRVWTGVTYAPFVVGSTEQAGFHGRRGWHTEEKVARSWVKERLQTIVRVALARVLRIG